MAESIYQAYPRKVAKDKAIAAISKAMKKISPSTLLEKTNVYAQSVKGKERNFIPHPATWFNGRRFNDDPEEWQHPMNSAPSTARALDLAGRGEYESTAIES